MSRYLTCRACDHKELCHATQMVQRLRQLGMLRRAADPDPDLLGELFASALPKIACAACGETGMFLEEVQDEGWEDERCCEECGQVIAAERLEILPGTTLCSRCAQAGNG